MNSFTPRNIRKTSYVSESQCTQWSDTRLLQSVLVNDESGWVELLRRFRPLIFRCMARITNRYSSSLSAADLDEIYAEVLMHLVRDNMHKLRAFDPTRGCKLGSWLGMITINATYDYLRGQARRPLLDRLDGTMTIMLESQDHEEPDSPLEVLLEKERLACVDALLTDFTDKDKYFVDLYFRKGMEAEEIAHEMNISLKTVYTKKHKIRGHLLRSLSEVSAESPLSGMALAA
jgi:RNA polymerase sigma-70 factor, ECF subfamily